MNDMQLFIAAWVLFIAFLAFASKVYDRYQSRKAKARIDEIIQRENKQFFAAWDRIYPLPTGDTRTQKQIDAEIAEADDWCKQHVRNTTNFHRANRYYHEFE